MAYISIIEPYGLDAWIPLFSGEDWVFLSVNLMGTLYHYTGFCVDALDVAICSVPTMYSIEFVALPISYSIFLIGYYSCPWLRQEVIVYAACEVLRRSQAAFEERLTMSISPYSTGSLYCTFLALLIANVLGLIPFSLMLTAHLSTPFYFSIVYFINHNIIGCLFYGTPFCNVVYPKDTPLFLVAIMIVIDTISYLARLISLAVRLFANMLAAHVLFTIFLTAINMVIFKVTATMPALLSMGLVFVVLSFEVVICFLQAYVLVLLVMTYFSYVINLH